MSKKIELDEYLQKFKARKRLRIYVIVGVVAVLLIAIYILSHKREGSGSGAREWIFAEVHNGDLSVTITEKGTIHPEKENSIGPQSRYSRQVEWLIPKGTMVKEDDLLIKLKSDDIERRLEELENNLEQEISDIKVHLEQTEAERLTRKTKLEDAHRDLEKKTAELEKYQEVDHPKNRESKKFKEEQKKIDLEKAKINYNTVKKWQPEGFYSPNELDEAELQWKNAQRELAVAGQEFNSYLKYEHPEKLRTLQVDVVKSSDTIKNVMLQNRREENKSAERLRRLEQRKKRHENEIIQQKDELKNTRLVAPQDGMVVYKEIRWWRREVQVGDNVYAGMSLMSIPSFRSMIAKINVQEFDIHKVDTGTSCTIVLDANPDKVYTGKITDIAALGSPDRVTKNNVFETTVILMEEEPTIKPGMGCRVTILVKDLRDVTYVPIEAVFQHEGKEIVYVKTDGKKWERRDVQVGESNDSDVVIESGAKPGEQVLLLDPTLEGYTFEEEEQEEKNGKAILGTAQSFPSQISTSVGSVSSGSYSAHSLTVARVTQKGEAKVNKPGDTFKKIVKKATKNK